MESKSNITPEERERARQMIAGISNKHAEPSNIGDPTAHTGNGFPLLVGIIGMLVGAVTIWGYLEFTKQPSQVASPTVAKIAASPSPPDNTPQKSVIQVVAPQTNTIVRHPPKVMAKPITNPVYQSPTPQRADPMIELNRLKQRHADAALSAAKRKFRYDYQLGSGNVRVLEVELYDTETTQIPGWPRYRTEGTAGIAYYDSRGSFTRTTRKFEVLTEDQSGTIKTMDISVK